jgi:hypothetical protein
MPKDKVMEILEKLVRDPELKKYPHSYNPIIIERASQELEKLLLSERMCKRCKEKLNEQKP